MMTTTEMMKTTGMNDMPMPSGLDMMAMQEAIDACSTCMQACTMCADAMGGMADMGTCASRCAMCADVCMTTMRMMMRPAGMEHGAMVAMLEACMAMCRSCMTECMTHAEMSATCAMCAQACEACMTACRTMLTTMTASVAG